ncbi:hypothetical protein Pelo_962 [Pelomyxa schiedti]|nr:hypothetical protein Pelo_962 [Pelomyxa schiedti]
MFLGVGGCGGGGSSHNSPRGLNQHYRRSSSDDSEASDGSNTTTPRTSSPRTQNTNPPISSQSQTQTQTQSQSQSQSQSSLSLSLSPSMRELQMEVQSSTRKLGLEKYSGTPDVFSAPGNRSPDAHPVTLHKPTIIVDRVVYIRHPVKVIVTVQKEWRLHWKLSEGDLFAAVIACKCFASDSSSSEELTCFTCSVETGKIVVLSTSDKTPRIDTKTGREQYVFMLRSLCKSSRDHLAGDLNIVVMFPKCPDTSMSTPFSLRSRAPSKYAKCRAPTCPTPPESNQQMVCQQLPRLNLSLDRISYMPPIVVRLGKWSLPRESVQILVRKVFCNSGLEIPRHGVLALRHAVIDNPHSPDTYFVMITTYDHISSARTGPVSFMNWLRTPSMNCLGVDPISASLLCFLGFFESF